MLEHIAGRPSASWKRSQVVLVLFFTLWQLLRGNSNGPRIVWLRRFNKFLKRYTPWQITIVGLTALYAMQNLDSLLGLSSPEPLANLYSPDFYRATWITTALDTGFATAMTVKPKFVRDILSLVFSLYYLVNARAADEKLRRFRALCTVEMLRTTWEKTTNPYIRAFTFFDRPRMPIARPILLARPEGSPYTRPLRLWIFFAGGGGDERALGRSTELIFDVPGGGFVSMDPRHHEDRLRHWAIKSGRPVISLDYGKAPEYPFPWAVQEAFDLYRLLIESSGRVIGMSGRSFSFALTGDSAGANIASNLIFKILEHPTPLPLPVSVAFAYAALDFNIASWMSPEHMRVLRTEHSHHPSSSTADLASLLEGKDHLAHRSPLATVKDTQERRPRRNKDSWSRSLSGTFQKYVAAPLSPVVARSSTKKGKTTASGAAEGSKRLSPPRKPSASSSSTGAFFEAGARGLTKILPTAAVPNALNDAQRVGSSSSTIGSSSGSETKVSSSTASGHNLPSHSSPRSRPQPSSFKSRVQRRASEVQDLSIDTDVRSPSPRSHPTLPRRDKGVQGDNLDVGPTSASLRAVMNASAGLTSGPSPGGVDADDDDDDDEDEDPPEVIAAVVEDGEGSGSVLSRLTASPERVDEGDNDDQFEPLLDEEKPLSARILIPASNLEDELEIQIERRLASKRARQEEEERRLNEVHERETRQVEKAMRTAPIGTRLTMTSRVSYFQDRVVSASMMRAMAILYIGPKRAPDFQTDYYISPVLAPASHLARFPPMFMMCGEKDPFVDDTVIFSGRLREAKRTRRAELRAKAAAAGGIEALSSTEAELLRTIESESEDDWVQTRILSGWGHGFMQMIALLGKPAMNATLSIPEYLDAQFAAHRRREQELADRLRVQVTSATPTRNDFEALRHSAPGGVRPGLNGTARPSYAAKRQVAKNAVAFDLDNPTAPNNIRPGPPDRKSRSASRSRAPLTSETEGERDKPLTFTPRRNRSPHGSSSSGSAASRRRSYDNGSAKTSSNAKPQPRRDAIVPVAAPSSISRPPLFSLSSAADSPITPSVEGSPVIEKKDPSASPLAAVNGLSPEVGKGSGRVDGLELLTRLANQTGGERSRGADLLTEEELLKRRRADAVLGLGDAIATQGSGGGLTRDLSRTWTTDHIDANANGI